MCTCTCTLCYNILLRTWLFMNSCYSLSFGCSAWLVLVGGDCIDSTCLCNGNCSQGVDKSNFLNSWVISMGSHTTLFTSSSYLTCMYMYVCECSQSNEFDITVQLSRKVNEIRGERAGCPRNDRLHSEVMSRMAAGVHFHVLYSPRASSTRN